VATELDYEAHDDVGVITLNRPDARNALTLRTYAELEDAVRTTTARCLVVTGADPAFCWRAVELLLTGRLVDAGEAAQIGLVSRVVPHDELLPTALALARDIAANPPLAVRAIKRGLREALDPDWSALGSWVSTTLAHLFTTDDHKEGVAAFLEKRDPAFRSR
jgi:enoyl-CoA hydratase/carnithine racemase